jgi:hypothetical protein
MTNPLKDLIARLKKNCFVFKNRRRFKKFRKRHGYPLNIWNPRTFNEKIQWIKFFGGLERYSSFVDKFDVRRFVEERCGKELLVPLIGVYEKADHIDHRSLPNSCVIKATHGSGWNIMVRDKTKLDWDSTKGQLNEWIGLNYFEETGEPNYKPLRGRIIIEEYLEDPSGDLKDYKFFCSKGEPRYIQVDSERFADHKRDFYSIDWERMPMREGYMNLPRPLARPARIGDMIAVCKKLSEGFPFVRVDLYLVNDRIYFGELTFTDGNGANMFSPAEYDLLFGDLIDLDDYGKLDL